MGLARDRVSRHVLPFRLRHTIVDQMLSVRFGTAFNATLSRLAVGTPVTRRPLHSPGRAVLPVWCKNSNELYDIVINQYYG